MGRATYKLKQSQNILPRKQEDVMPITHSEWQRIKDLVVKLKPPKAIFSHISSLMAGVFTTSLFSWIAFDGGEDERYKIAIICICVISLILTVAFWFLHKSQQEYNGMIGQDIICEMDRIEEQFTSSVSDGDDIPLL